MQERPNDADRTCREAREVRACSQRSVSIMIAQIWNDFLVLKRVEAAAAPGNCPRATMRSHAIVLKGQSTAPPPTRWLHMGLSACLR